VCTKSNPDQQLTIINSLSSTLCRRVVLVVGRNGEANAKNRASPPPRLPISNLRETNIQPRLLHPPRFLFETRYTAIRTSTRAANATDEELAELVVAAKGPHEEDRRRSKAKRRDHWDTGEYKGRPLCQSQGHVWWSWVRYMTDRYGGGHKIDLGA
jgi:hypothetical protein